ncbi:EAL domain-containing protein [Alkalinema sp. FACHB-956]|uniref:putative bifunctional diguanylate cyclase/phosphodiesterase n=1 Tax=Alkalinema sp. FACHB-956 TaxID=2692768 RepID=UPI001683AEFF|nr:EAL domain-containing protein [Alkalinema sp. FACHB-956]MBD2326230.1 EAL domain-containing protein [Alkalinema sp. FACHB-956]
MTGNLSELVVQTPQSLQDVAGQELPQALQDPIALISHELRTPLNSIRGALGLLYDGKLHAQSQQGQALLSMALRNIDRLIRLAEAIEKETVPVMTIWTDSDMEQFHLEREFEQALQTQSLEVFYQPIVILQTHQVIGFEALARWRHPQRGFISPAVFIPIAERIGRIQEVDRLVLRTACHQLKVWQQQFPELQDLTMSVNLSALQLSQPDLVPYVATVLQETGITPNDLILEVTESAILENPETDVEVLQHLRDLGVQLAIDDFGTGYSSLSRLYALPITELKIDRSFICNQQWQMIEGITRLAASLGPEVVVEGIETETELNALLKIGCQKAQGFFFARPMDKHGAETLLASGRTSVALI